MDSKHKALLILNFKIFHYDMCLRVANGITSFGLTCRGLVVVVFLTLGGDLKPGGETSGLPP